MDQDKKKFIELIQKSTRFRKYYYCGRYNIGFGRYDELSRVIKCAAINKPFDMSKTATKKRLDNKNYTNLKTYYIRNRIFVNIIQIFIFSNHPGHQGPKNECLSCQ